MGNTDFGLVSVIMAAYNAENTIRQAIVSVLKQSYKNLELLVIDDCSLDSTAEIVNNMAVRDGRIKLICHQENMGVSYSRRHGVEQAKGDWIAILDSDDRWVLNKLEKQIQMQKVKNAELLFTGSAFIDEKGKGIRWHLHVPQEVGYKKLLKQNIISNSSVLVKKSLYKKFCVVNDDIHEDFAVWLSITKSGRKAYSIDEPLLIYRLAKTSRSGNKLYSARMNWNTYRYMGLNIGKACYYMAWYMVNGVLKYHNLR